MKSPAVVAVLTAVLALSACASTTPTSTERPSEAAAPSAPRSTTLAPQPTVPGKTFTATPLPTPTKPKPPKPKPTPKETPPPKASKKKAPVYKSRLAGREWGVYKGPADQMWNPYLSAGPKQKALLSYLVNQPKAQWFGAWIPEREIYDRTRAYIENAQGGDPKKLVQMTVFRMDPWYTESKKRAPSPKEQAAYRAWIDNQVKAIGNTPVAIVLQPDLTFLRTVPNFELSSSLIKYAAKKYGALPNALVYLEAGAADWPAAGQGGAPEAVRLLSASGIEYVDGIATNTTHYSSTALDVRRIAEIVQLFEARGIRGLKGVINTSSNGQPFEFGLYQGPDPDEAWPCKSAQDKRTCVALGIPPTADVANPKWGLDEETRKLARKYVDAYLWIGRPWLHRQNSPFLMDKALTLVKTSQYR